tara:strand:- start:7830 stop:8021 length:192 start_codon:yes stop_codon:yes gene_type:complete
MSNVIKVNWYEEELDKFYTTCKDNNGYIHGIYTFDNDEQNYCECFWFKTEQERDKKYLEFSKQ